MDDSMQLGVMVQAGITVMATLAHMLFWLAIGLLGARASVGSARIGFVVTGVVGVILAILMPAVSTIGTASVARVVGPEQMMLGFSVIHGITATLGFIPFLVLLVALFLMPRSQAAVSDT